MKLKISNMCCHSGGATGADSYFESICNSLNIKVKAYSYNTYYHTSKNKVEISIDDYNEGFEKIKEANKLYLKRKGIDKYMNLLARNWAQVKYSDEIFAVSTINFENNTVNGGTGYAVAMGILENKDVYVFDQKLNKWFKYSYILNKFIEKNKENINISKNNFAGIGTRELNNNGKIAIYNLFY